MIIPHDEGTKIVNFGGDLQSQYFITICTAGRQYYFGKIEHSTMILTDAGKICEQQIKQLEITRPYIEIHEFVVMPNHIHLLLLLGNWRRGGSVTHPITDDTEGGLTIRPYKGSTLSSIIQSLKANITKQILKQGISVPFDDSFGRKRSFHDHIIRNQQSYDQIKFAHRKSPWGIYPN